MIADAKWEAAIRKSVREQMLKVSFGGDRSEAGRFAANQRWKDHVKGEVKTPVSAKAKDITKDLAVYFGFGDDHSFYRQILKGSEGDKEIKKRTNQLLLDGKEIGDIQLQIIAEKQGFAGKPTVVSSEKMKQLEKEGWKIVYRGIKDVFKPEATGVVLHTSKELAKEFVAGDYWAGRGYMGNGIYFSDVSRIAREYSYISDAYRGTLLKVAIPPNIIMKKEQFVQTVIDKQSSLEHAFGGDQDMGRYLAAMGHRAVEAKENYFIVWDRSMLAVEELSVV